ncbi:MAG: hypothetical protein GC201_01170 [Alphaproteobacteria bacterium]|nr:hypothetical protein [Alphaproteobacteria bacterium]
MHLKLSHHQIPELRRLLGCGHRLLAACASAEDFRFVQHERRNGSDERIRAAAKLILDAYHGDDSDLIPSLVTVEPEHAVDTRPCDTEPDAAAESNVVHVAFGARPRPVRRLRGSPDARRG